MGPATGERNLADQLLVLWSRRYLLLAAVAGSAALTFLWSRSLPPTYRTTATLVISDAKMPGEQRADARTYADTYAALIESVSVAAGVVEELGLERQFGLTPERLVDQLTVRAVPGTLLITVSLDFPDAALAAKIVNAQTTAAVALSRSMATTNVTDTRDYLQQQVAAAQRDLADREAQLQKVKADVRYEEASKRLESLIELRGKLGEDLATAEQDAAASTAAAEAFRQGLGAQDRVLTLNRSVIDDPALNEAANAGGTRTAAERLGLQMKTQEVNPLHAQSEPEFLKVTALAAGASSRRDTVRRQMQANEVELRQLEGQLAGKWTRLQGAQRDYDLAKSAYEGFTKSFENARLSVRAQVAELKLVSPATPRGQVVGPRVALNVAISVVASLILAMFVVLFFGYLTAARRLPVPSGAVTADIDAGLRPS